MSALEPEIKNKLERSWWSASSPCSALVTRYPTGSFGIAHKGSMFWWWSFSQAEIHQKLKEMGLSPENVKWEERYYDGDYRNPANYKTRPFYPQNIPVNPPR